MYHKAVCTLLEVYHDICFAVMTLQTLLCEYKTLIESYLINSTFNITQQQRKHTASDLFYVAFT